MRARRACMRCSPSSSPSSDCCTILTGLPLLQFTSVSALSRKQARHVRPDILDLPQHMPQKAAGPPSDSRTSKPGKQSAQNHPVHCTALTWSSTPRLSWGAGFEAGRRGRATASPSPPARRASSPPTHRSAPQHGDRPSALSWRRMLAGAICLYGVTSSLTQAYRDLDERARARTLTTGR